MDYEKAYKNLVAKVKNAHLYAQTDSTKNVLEDILPELRESEEETTRKELLDFVKSFWADHKEALPQTSRWVTYLEKQKEQKPEHFELKAGKWYFCHRAFCCRADHLTVKEGERFMCEKDGVVKGFVIKEPEKYFIECSAPAPMEDEQKEQKPAEWSERHIADIFEKVGLAKIVREQGNDALTNAVQSAMIELRKVENTEWSEEDEFFRQQLIVYCEKCVQDTLAAKCVDWLKSLRPQPHWKPSEEQMVVLEKFVDYLHESGNEDYEAMESLYNDLKKLM